MVKTGKGMLAARGWGGRGEQAERRGAQGSKNTLRHHNHGHVTVHTCPVHKMYTTESGPQCELWASGDYDADSTVVTSV